MLDETKEVQLRRNEAASNVAATLAAALLGKMTTASDASHAVGLYKQILKELKDTGGVFVKAP